MATKKKEEKVGDDKLISELEKKYGMSRVSPEDLTVVSTGSLQLNQAMGVGGTALGKIVEIFGPESSGKSTITLHQMAEYQKAFPHKKVALFDYENSFDRKYASSIGVNVNDLLIYQPENQEEGYDMILGLIQQKLVSCVVLDSQTAAPPKAILQGDMGDATIGLQARINSKFCLKIKGILNISEASLFIISQTRNNIGGMGDPNTTTGGNAIKFYADVRWKVWKMNDKDNERNKTTIDVIKNKLASPFGQAKINIEWGKGFDTLGEIIDYAIEFGMITKSGSWFKYGDMNVQGIDKVKDYLEENSEVLLHIEKMVMDSLTEAEMPLMDMEVIEEEIVSPES